MGTRFGAENWIDVEITFTAFDTGARSRSIIFNPVDESPSMRDGEVNMDTFRKICGQSKKRVNNMLDT